MILQNSFRGGNIKQNQNIAPLLRQFTKRGCPHHMGKVGPGAGCPRGDFITQNKHCLHRPRPWEGPSSVARTLTWGQEVLGTSHRSLSESAERCRPPLTPLLSLPARSFQQAFSIPADSHDKPLLPTVLTPGNYLPGTSTIIFSRDN